MYQNITDINTKKIQSAKYIKSYKHALIINKNNEKFLYDSLNEDEVDWMKNVKVKD